MRLRADWSRSRFLHAGSGACRDLRVVIREHASGRHRRLHRDRLSPRNNHPGNDLQGCETIRLSPIHSRRIWLAQRTRADGCFMRQPAQGVDIFGSGGICPNCYAAPTPLAVAVYPSTAISVNGQHIIPLTVVSSVNGEVNVMAPPFNAKGDCSTDDFTPITTAMTYANTFTPPLTVVFPNPPGGCYLTSTLTWLGVPLEGRAPMGILPAQGTAGVVIQGEPGEDIFHAPDPTLVSTPIPNKSWSIRDINFIVDSSVDVSATIGAHRWPGRWVQDAGMVASSAVITSPHAMFTCGDVGQAIEVMGAGPAGAPLVSTIASVVPCAPIENATYPRGATVTLAATASTTVTAGTGTAYISVAGLSVTQTVGNAAIAFDCKDGDRTHYTMGGGAGYVETEVDELTNIKVASTTGTNNSAGIFMQGCWASYDLRALNVWLNGLTFGGVFVPSELDSYQTTGLRDYLNWTGGQLEATYPWISYDGSKWNHDASSSLLRWLWTTNFRFRYV